MPALTGDVVEVVRPSSVPWPVLWRVVRAPYGSLAYTYPAGESGNALLRDVRSERQAGVDLPGYYVLSAEPAGGSGSNPVLCSVTVMARTGLLVSNTQDFGQMAELRLLRKDAQGRFCDSDVRYATRSGIPVDADCDDGRNKCESNYCAQGYIRWSPAGSTENDPIYIAGDDRQSPEVIGIPTPLPGDYLVTLFFRGGSSEVVTMRERVQVHLNGWPESSWVLDLVGLGQYASVALIHVPESGPPCVSDARGPVAGQPRCPERTPCTTALCTQCTDDGACGPGLRCNVSTALCQPSPVSACTSSATCGEHTCVAAYQECRMDSCFCFFSNTSCEESVRACGVAAPVCSGTDEPDNSLETARRVDAPALVEAELCRDDTDVVAVNVTTAGLLLVRAAFPVGGISLSERLSILQDGQELAFSVRRFSHEPPIFAVAGVAPGTVEVRLSSSVPTLNQLLDDTVRYHLTAKVHVGVGCATDPDEPNNTQQAATPLALGDERMGTVCGTDTDDWWEVIQPAGSYLRVMVSSVEPGYSVYPYVVDSNGVNLVDHNSFGGMGMVRLGNGMRHVFVHVPAGYNMAEPNRYFIQVDAVPAPSCGEAWEPNDVLESPAPAPNAMFSGTLCTTEDVDVFSFDTGAAGPLSVTVDFPLLPTATVTLLDAAGTVVATADWPPQALSLVSNVPAGHYVVRISLAPYVPLVPQNYAVTLTSGTLILGGGP